MHWGGSNGGLEIRRDMDGGVTLSGRFNYGSVATLRGGASPKRETFEAGAFRGRIEGGEDIHLLAGHSFDKPLASRNAGGLKISDDNSGVSFEARIGPELLAVSHIADTVAQVESGLVRGLSPGFVVKPDAVSVTREGGGTLRRIRGADLHEMSIVTVPAYPDAQVELRSWAAETSAPRGLTPSQRWRA